MDRLPGRYNLHRLGWKAFEDLVIEINRTILGATVTPFRVGADEGRDGFFKGKVLGEYESVAKGACSVAIQCKHSSSAGDGITWSDVSGEAPKIATLAKDGEADLFVVFSNRRVGAENERIIRQKFEAIEGVKSCRVFGEEWIESHIDGNFRLLRRVPRLFGIGDLSQILSHNVSQQTRLILEEMQSEQAVFVPTPSYRSAVAAMEEYGIVVLIGPPASGKSAIALNLCMVLGAEDEDLEVLKIETAEQFTSAWSAEDKKKLFWIEDFFGETTLDEQRTKPWAAAFDKVVTARKAGNKFIFTCRDYILKDAHSRIKKSKMELFDERSIYVRVDNLSAAERERILYNHVKMGSITTEKKREIKKFLPTISALPAFTPEIARRIGAERFHRNLKCDLPSLREFVEKPVQFFADVIHDLGPAEQAVIAYLLLSNNSLPDPVLEVPSSVRAAYGVDVAAVRSALKNLNGSLAKLNIVGTHRVWQVHHPSMIDAMHRNLKEHGAMLDLFVDGAPINVVLRDCITRETEHKLFVPESLYDRLFSRVAAADPVAAAGFLGNQCEEFLRHILTEHPGELATIIGNGFDTNGNHLGLQLLLLLEQSFGAPFEHGMRAVEQTLEEAFWSYACTESIFSEEYSNPVDAAVVRKCLSLYESKCQDTVEVLVDRALRESKSPSNADDVYNHLKGFRHALTEVAKRLFSEDEYKALYRYTDRIFDEAEETLEEHIGRWEAHLEDQYKESRYFSDGPKVEASADMFSDVDQ